MITFIIFCMFRFCIFQPIKKTALGAYYDVMSSSDNLPLFEILEESTHVGSNSVQPHQTFIKIWRFRNIGITNCYKYYQLKT